MATTISVESTPGGGSYVDLTSYLLQGSVTVKVNTLDFTLTTPPAIYGGAIYGVPLYGGSASTQLTAKVKMTDPAWSGSIVSVTSYDPVDLRNGVEFVTVAATNSTVLAADTAPFDLSDVPSAAPPFDYLLEDSSGHYLIEDGTDFAPGALMLEGAWAQGYAALSVQTSVNATAGGPPQTLGRANVFVPGLRPGNVFNLTSFNQGYSATPFEITQVTSNWPGLSTTPFFAIEFGDTPATLALWTQINAPLAAPVVAPPPPAATPPTVTIYGACTGVTGLQAAGGGIVTIATNTFSVSHALGRVLTCQVQGAIDARMDIWDNYVAAPRRSVRAILSGGIFTGAWQELPFGLARATYDLSSASGIALPDGTYTVSIQIDTQEYNQMRIYGEWAQVAVTST